MTSNNYRMQSDIRAVARMSLSLCCAFALNVGFERAMAFDASDKSASSVSSSGATKTALDTSGKKRIGKASFYASRFAGRKMANGERMDSRGNNAASKTLPLGTTAKVTNLDTGQSTVVTIQDRGPYASGRIVDLSPSTAAKIGISKTDGVAKVEVAPIAVPLVNGGVKLGAAVIDPKTSPPTKASEHSNWE